MSNEATTNETAEKQAAKLYPATEQGLTDAKNAANSKNAAPLAEGKEKRNPYKVYGISVSGVLKGYAIGQTPTSALSPIASDCGVSVDRVDNENLMPVSAYLAKLSPEELERAAEFIKRATTQAA